MSTRLNFYHNHTGKTLKELIIESFADFSKWYLERNDLSVKNGGVSYGSAPLIQLCETQKSLKSTFHILDKKLIDELTEEFVNEYAYISNLLTCIGSDWPIKYYKKCHSLVVETNNLNFIKHWDSIFKGRSLLPSEPFESFSNYSTIGYLYYSECFALKEAIQSHFGDELQNNSKEKGFMFILEALQKNKQCFTRVNYQYLLKK